MTELEFEKASRGTKAPVADEYVWGTTTIHESAYTITNDGLANATVNEGSGTGNATYNTTAVSIGGPLRGGIFAASFAMPSRQESGATFYGVMEMGGNVWERLVTIGNGVGRAFTGTHGDGRLTPEGNPDAALWPEEDAFGAGYRGGTWQDQVSNLQISDRNRAEDPLQSPRPTDGFRAVRSAL